MGDPDHARVGQLRDMKQTSFPGSSGIVWVDPAVINTLRTSIIMCLMGGS